MKLRLVANAMKELEVQRNLNEAKDKKIHELEMQLQDAKELYERLQKDMSLGGDAKDIKKLEN